MRFENGCHGKSTFFSAAGREELNKSGGAATVVSQEGTQVRIRHREDELNADMVGFPLGFKLRPGERVILADEPSGLTARPLVRAIRTAVRREALERDRQVEVGGRRFVMQESTVVELEPREDEPPSGDGTLWVVEPGEAEGPSQVIAVRWPRH